MRQTTVALPLASQISQPAHRRLSPPESRTLLFPSAHLPIWAPGRRHQLPADPLVVVDALSWPNRPSRANFPGAQRRSQSLPPAHLGRQLLRLPGTRIGAECGSHSCFWPLLLGGYDDRILIQSVARHCAACRRTNSAQTKSPLVQCFSWMCLSASRVLECQTEYGSGGLLPRGSPVLRSPPIAMPLSGYELLALGNTQTCPRAWGTNEKGDRLVICDPSPWYQRAAEPCLKRS